MSARFTIGRQLSVSFFAVAVAVLAIGASTLHGVSELADINQRITGEGAERYTLVMRFERDIAINGARTWSLLKTSDKAYIAATHKEIDEASAALDRLEQKIRERSWTDEGRAILMRSEQARDAYRKVRADLISRHTRGEEVAAQVDAALGPSMKAYQDALGALAAHEQGMFESAALQGAATATRTRLVVFSAIAGATVAVFGLGLWLSRRITRRVKSATRVVRAVATGDLQTEIVSEGSDEVADLLSNLEQMTASLRTLIASMGATAAGIRHASSEIAAGSLDLSGRTETAASNLQQTASNMMQISQSVSANADSARQANQLAMSASEVAERGGSVVGQVVSTMDGISESSNRIAEIISVIDGIAFQTNILALNAAVEAARAGEQGRGFAVVAGEVRNLAQRSADAARQIKELISSSVAEVENGSRLVKDAGATMHEIVTSVRRVADIIGEITSATLEQTSQITQITSAIGQLESMTSQNAALVEQSSAAAESLTEQAQRLAGSVAGFRIGREQSVALDSPPERRASTVPSGLTPRSAPSAPAATTRPLASPSRTPAADDALLRPRLPARQAPAASSPSLAAGAQPTAQSGPQGSGTPSSSLPKAVAQPASAREADDDWESF